MPTESGQDVAPMSDREVELATAVARLEGRVEAAERGTREALDRTNAYCQGEVQSILDNLRALERELGSVRSTVSGANGNNGIVSRVARLEAAADAVRHGPQVPVEVHTAIEAVQGRLSALEGLEERRLRRDLVVLSASVAAATGLVLLLLRVSGVLAP